MIKMDKQKLERQVRLLAIVEKLHSLGLSWEEAEKFPFALPRVDSGYSMGEKIYWKFQDSTILVEDYTDEYAKSCTWRAKHGRVVINFTSKKQLKEFTKKAINFKLTDDDVEKVLDKKYSELKNGKFSCYIRKELFDANYRII